MRYLLVPLQLTAFVDVVSPRSWARAQEDRSEEMKKMQKLLQEKNQLIESLSMIPNLKKPRALINSASAPSPYSPRQRVPRWSKNLKELGVHLQRRANASLGSLGLSVGSERGDGSDFDVGGTSSGLLSYEDHEHDRADEIGDETASAAKLTESDFDGSIDLSEDREGEGEGGAEGEGELRQAAGAAASALKTAVHDTARNLQWCHDLLLAEALVAGKVTKSRPRSVPVPVPVPIALTPRLTHTPHCISHTASLTVQLCIS